MPYKGMPVLFHFMQTDDHGLTQVEMRSRPAFVTEGFEDGKADLFVLFSRGDRIPHPTPPPLGHVYVLGVPDPMQSGVPFGHNEYPNRPATPNTWSLQGVHGPRGED